jgi:hypothetical protein
MESHALQESFKRGDCGWSGRAAYSEAQGEWTILESSVKGLIHARVTLVCSELMHHVCEIMAGSI